MLPWPPSAHQTTTMSSQGPYINKVQALQKGSTTMKTLLESKGSHMTKAFYTNWVESYPVNSPDDLIAQSARLKESGSASVCIIENISAEYIEALGRAWQIDPKFFAGHATNPAQDRLWWREQWHWDLAENSPGEAQAGSQAPLESSMMDAASIQNGKFGHMDGIFEYQNEFPDLEPSIFEKLNSVPNLIHRHCFKDGKWPIQSNTRISYCRPNNYMYMFLVDAPLEFPPGILDISSRSFPTLRFPISENRGGVELPRLLSSHQSKYSVFENLKVFCQHGWHQHMLFGPYHLLSFHGGVGHNIIPCHPLIYLWSSCLWEENLRRLDKDIKHISFREIRNPRLEINSELHDKREDLAVLKNGLLETAMYIPPNVTDYFHSHQWERSSTRRSPRENLEGLTEDAAKLESFLMETFQLFMSSISVQDTRLTIEQSRLSIDQAQRASRLTVLAFIYVPLSFVTGIFGMNIQQINGSGLSIWVCFVAVAAAVFVTLPVFWVVNLYGNRNNGRETGKSTRNSEV